ncbi:hypothetical protein CQW23_06257 [Capsicum baccatum]|uniref:Uncharacterized protein n=1 Tax=Capsicum baccatum TaxID=33114 RepID=A0A2G2X2T5_CAPBA|nr:hypothetical protein CQW23_06257 [Capsicum baccatum]
MAMREYIEEFFDLLSLRCRVKKGDKRAIFELTFSEHELHLCLMDSIEAAYRIALRVEGPTGSAKNQKPNKGSEDKSENMPWRRSYLLMSKKGIRSRRRFGRGDGAGKGDQQGDQRSLLANGRLKPQPICKNCLHTLGNGLSLPKLDEGQTDLALSALSAHLPIKAAEDLT